MGTGKNKQRAVIVSAAGVGPAVRAYLQPGDFIVACDAGYLCAGQLGVMPNLIIGDFDSAPAPEERQNCIILPHVKDDTDTHFAACWLLEHGYREITMLGALGGRRLEHTLANLQTGLFLARAGVRVLLADERSELCYLLPGKEQTLSAAGPDGTLRKYFSLFAMGGPVEGVTLRGASYPLENAVLRPEYPVGVSNEFAAPQITASCTKGCGLMVLTRADQ